MSTKQTWATVAVVAAIALAILFISTPTKASQVFSPGGGGGAGAAQSPWTSDIDGAGYNLSNTGSITGTYISATSTSATSTFSGDVTASQVSIFNQNSGANHALFSITPTKTYGSSSQNQGDGALLVTCTADNGICEQITRNNASAVAPLRLDFITNTSDANTVDSIITGGTGAALTLSQTNSNNTQASESISNAGKGAGLLINMTNTASVANGLRINATTTNAAATTVLLRQPNYVTIALEDLSLCGSTGNFGVCSSGAGTFQLTDRNDAFRFEGRQQDDTQFNVAGIFNRPNAGGQFVWGGAGDIFSVPTGVAMLNVVMSSSTLTDYFDLTSTTTSPSLNGNIFKVTNSGLVGIGTTSPYAPLSVVGRGGIVAESVNATSSSATSTFAGPIASNGFFQLSAPSNVYYHWQEPLLWGVGATNTNATTNQWQCQEVETPVQKSVTGINYSVGSGPIGTHVSAAIYQKSATSDLFSAATLLVSTGSLTPTATTSTNFTVTVPLATTTVSAGAYWACLQWDNASLTSTFLRQAQGGVNSLSGLPPGSDLMFSFATSTFAYWPTAASTISGSITDTVNTQPSILVQVVQ